MKAHQRRIERRRQEREATALFYSMPREDQKFAVYWHIDPGARVYGSTYPNTWDSATITISAVDNLGRK